MGLPLEKIEADLPNLPRGVRARWAEILLSSLKDEDEIADAWKEEMERRHQQYLAGESKPIPAKEVIAELPERLREESLSDIERAWDAEIGRRVAELRAGTAETIPAEQVFGEMDELLKDDE